MSELKTQIEEFILIENEIYRFLKIEEHYLILFHAEKQNQYSIYDPTTYASLEHFQEFKEKFIFQKGFEKDPLSVLKMKTIIRLTPSLLEFSMPRVENNQSFVNLLEGKKTVFFDRWLQNCENQMKMIEAQREYIVKQLELIK